VGDDPKSDVVLPKKERVGDDDGVLRLLVTLAVTDVGVAVGD